MSGLLDEPVPAEAAQSELDDIAEKLFGSTNKPEPAALPDDATPAERMFAATQTHDVAGRTIAASMVEHGGLAPEQAQAVAAEWSPVFAAAGLSNSESATLAEVGVALHQRPASDEQRAQWLSMAQDALRSDYRPEGVAQALADARTLVQQIAQKHPGIAAWLDLGIGDHPQVVRVIAAKARELRKAGRL